MRRTTFSWCCASTGLLFSLTALAGESDAALAHEIPQAAVLAMASGQEQVSLANFSVAREKRGTITLTAFNLASSLADRSSDPASKAAALRPKLRRHYVGQADADSSTLIGLSVDPDGSNLRGFLSTSDGFFSLRPSTADSGNQRLLIPHEYSGRTTGADHRERLLRKAAVDSRVPAVVTLRTPFTPEGDLGDRWAEDQQFAIAAMQRRVLEQLGDASPARLRLHKYVPHLAAEFDRADLEKLAGLPEVELLQEPIIAHLSLARSGPLVGAPQAWGAGFTGAGQTIAIIDSGIDTEHLMFENVPGRQKIVAEACYTTDNCPTGTTGTGTGVDCGQNQSGLGCMHGSHVAGIAAGDISQIAPDSSAPFIGVARDATLISIQVNDANGNIDGSNVSRALERILELRTLHTIAAVNMSLGSNGPGENMCDDRLASLKDAVANLRSFGIAAVAASGNDGFTNGIDWPACVSTVISVGASTSDTDSIHPISNNAASLDLIAPGHSASPITSAACMNLIGLCSAATVAPGTARNLRFTSTNGFGTSQAAPHVSAALAIMRDSDPNASIEAMLSALKATGTLLDDGKTTVVEQLPRINIKAALDQLSQPPTATLTVTINGLGRVTSSPAGIMCGQDGGFDDCMEDYPVGGQVTLTPVVTDGAFVNWTGDADCSDGRVTMNQPKSCVANFAASPQPVLTVRINGSGRVASDPAGILCGQEPGFEACSSAFPMNQMVTLTPTETAGAFVNWTGNADCSDGQVTMNQNKTCTANFDDPQFVLTIVREGTGSGTVTSNPVGINCGSTCSANFTGLTVIDLAAVPASNSTFAGWQGPSDCSDGSVTISGDLTCRAVFNTVPVEPRMSGLRTFIDFEPPDYSGSTGGTALTNQDDFYLPQPDDSMPVNVHVSGSSNGLQLPIPSLGGQQIGAGTGPGDNFFLRSQRPVSFAEVLTRAVEPGDPRFNICDTASDCSGSDQCLSGTCVYQDRWDVCFDLAIGLLGVPPPPAVIGSLSLLDGDTTLMIAKAGWVDRNTPMDWVARYDLFDANGDPAAANCGSNLSPNFWWRWCTTVDLRTNRVLGCSVARQDQLPEITAMQTFSDRYLQGGSQGQAAPEALRLFVGGDKAIYGNTMGFDNILIEAKAIFRSGFE